MISNFQRRRTKTIYFIISLTIILGFILEAASINARASSKKAKLKNVKISLEKSRWVKKEDSEKGTTWYIVKGKKAKILVNPIFSKKISKIRITNRFKCTKKDKKILKLVKTGWFKAKKTGTAKIIIVTKVKKSRITYNQLRKTKLKLVVLSNEEFIKRFTKKSSASKKQSSTAKKNTTKRNSSTRAKTNTTSTNTTSSSTAKPTTSTALQTTQQKTTVTGTDTTKENDTDNEALPAYWKTYLDNKISTLKELDKQIGIHGFSFVFITDPHWHDNIKNSPKLIKYIVDNSATKRVICGGDILTVNSSISEAMNVLNSWRDETKDLNMINVFGNHDNNSNSGNDQSLWIGYDRWYGSVLQSIEKMVTFWSSDKKSFCIDDKAQKVRNIFLNTGYDQGECFDASQQEWLKKILSNMESGWKAIIFQHIYFESATKDIPELAPHTAGAIIKEVIDSQYVDMKNNDNELIAIISGHVHRDYMMKTANGYPIITTTCDAYGNQAAFYDPDNTVRERGTVTEQAFDVFHIDTETQKIYMTRIGAGSDRRIPYGI